MSTTREQEKLQKSASNAVDDLWTEIERLQLLVDKKEARIEELKEELKDMNELNEQLIDDVVNPQTNQ